MRRFSQLTGLELGEGAEEALSRLEAGDDPDQIEAELGEVFDENSLFAKQAFGEKVVQHQERKYGTTKFGLERFVNGFLDLLSITFVSKFGKRPMHLFGFLGMLMFVIGFLAALWLGIDKLFIDTRARLITSSPYFYISLTSMILGCQLFLAGFLGELISRNDPRRNLYQVEKKAL